MIAPDAPVDRTSAAYREYVRKLAETPRARRDRRLPEQTGLPVRTQTGQAVAPAADRRKYPWPTDSTPDPSDD